MVEVIPSGPVILGGVGGSGTRVVCEIVEALGTYVGADLNESHDNGWFALLLDRSRYYSTGFDRIEGELSTAIDILGLALGGPGPWSDEHVAFIDAAVAERARAGAARWSGNLKKSLQRAHRSRPKKAARWGFKNPSSHIYLAELHQHFPDLRYLMVLRHGLDMAFSGNQRQVRNWGPRYGVESPLTPSSSLEYWLRANEKAIAFGEEHLGDRFMRLDFELLCADPETEIRKLAAFIGADPDDRTIAALVKKPRTPQSVGRYRDHGLEGFTAEQLSRLSALGYEA